MRRLLVVWGLILGLLVCLPAMGRSRRALVIGLGEQEDRSWSKINGDKDVALVVTMLKSAGFGDIVTLKNSQATKSGIVNAFTSLIRKSGRGDVVYIHFSGHGQLMTDLDGDESDRLDESWIPYDAYMAYGPKDRGDKHLSDDEVGRYLTELRRKVGREGVIAVVVDACHSGDSSRATAAKEDTVVVRGVDVDFKIPGKKSGKRSEIKEDWLTLSACRDYQLNQEYQGVGRLTHILTGNWQSYVGDSDKTIFQKIDRTYESRKYKSKFQQNPDLTGETGKVLSTIFSRK